MMIYGFRNGSTSMDIFELVSGLRMNHAYIAPAGCRRTSPTRLSRRSVSSSRSCRSGSTPTRSCFPRNPVWSQRTKGVAVLEAPGALRSG